MSENIEGAAAKRAASGAGRSSGAFAGVLGYMLGRGGKRSGRGKGSGPMTAADFHNQEVARRYEHGRENENTLRDWQIDESRANTDFIRSESGKTNDFIRTRAGARDDSDIRKSEIASIARTGARNSAGNIEVEYGRGYSVSGTNPGAMPLKQVLPPKPPVKRTTTGTRTTGTRTTGTKTTGTKTTGTRTTGTRTTGTTGGRAGSAKDAIAPARSTVPKGKQFPSKSGVESVGGSAPVIY